MFLLGKYGVQTTFYFPMVKRGVVDLAVTGDWTPVAADCKVSKDGGAQANTTNAVAISTGVMWKLTLTATEMQATDIQVMIVDAATKAVEDQALIIYTYGNASAKLIAPDFSDTVRMGLTALPATASVSPVKKNTALANFTFFMVLASDHVTGATGLTVTATRSIDGAAFAACANAVSEIANGWYKISLAAADLNGDVITLKFTSATADMRGMTLLTQA